MCSSDTDPRILALSNWLTKQIKLDIQSLEPASSDASFRRYFRVIHTQGRHIIMDAPPDKENTEPFIRIAKLFGNAKLHVPAIEEINSEQGFLMLEDLGSTCLLDEINSTNADRIYGQALDSLLQLQTQLDISQCNLNQYDRPLLERELGIFSEWFLDKLLGIRLPESIKQPLHDLLISSALEQPQVCVHRDFHSRNLMIVDSNSPGIIDFQDAVIGPISYDLVSLLRDCYIQWPAQQVEQWAHTYYQRLVSANLVSVEFTQFKRWFDLMGLQRHLKAVGIFARLHLRDGKSNYLADIPRTLSYVSDVSRSYPELSAFSQFLETAILPIYPSKL
jgi:aminoglycoside/choline kinase family phosphotransferase